MSKMEDESILLLARISQRMQRSMYLLPGLRKALQDLGHPELVPILDLVEEDTGWTKEFGERYLRVQAARSSLGAMIDLAHLSKFGPKAKRLVDRVAKRI